MIYLNNSFIDFEFKRAFETRKCIICNKRLSFYKCQPDFIYNKTTYDVLICTKCNLRYELALNKNKVIIINFIRSIRDLLNELNKSIFIQKINLDNYYSINCFSDDIFESLIKNKEFKTFDNLYSFYTNYNNKMNIFK